MATRKELAVAVRERTAKAKGDSQRLNLLVPVEGVEPSTFALRMRCSTN
jgi:hypothetical protein